MSEQIYKTAGVTVDVVLFTIDEGVLKTLLIKRTNEPFKGLRALPGGFLQKDETSQQAANRILKNKAGVKDIYTEQLYAFDGAKRDPRGQVISITYFALTRKDDVRFEGSDIQTPKFAPVRGLAHLAFDHADIIGYALKRLQSKLEYTNVVYSLLRPKFTLTELQNAYEIILGKRLDKRNFRKKFLSLGLIAATKDYERGGKRRPALLYKFKAVKFSELKKFF